MKLDKKDIAGWIGRAGKSEQVAEFQYPYFKEKEFFVNIAHASRFTLNQIRQLAAEEYTDRRTRTREERLNEDKLNLGYAERIIKGWRGLTIKGLDELIPGTLDEAVIQFEEEKKKNPDVKIPSLEEIGKVEVEYSIETAVEILANSVDFMSWILDICGNAENYSRIAAKKEEQYENLKS